MAKNVNPKAWVLVLGEDNRRYSDAPVDTVPPSIPTIAVVDTAPTSITLQVTQPSIDARHPVVSYTFEFAFSEAGPWTERPPIGKQQAESGFDMTNLQSNTGYWFRARATDGAVAGNLSAYSNTVFAATESGSVAAGWFPNWPTMTTQTIQGNASDNILDSTKWDAMADFDIVIIQSFGPTSSRLTNRVNGINGIHALQTGMRTHVLVYTGYQQVLVNDTGDSALSVSKAVIDSPTKGNANWYMKRIAPNAGQILTANFNSTVRQLNIAVEAGVNSFGQTYAQAFWAEWKLKFDTGVPATDFYDVFDGVFQDNTNDRVPDVWNSTHTAKVIDYDLDYDGVGDGARRADFTPGGGGDMWARGTKASKDAFAVNFPNKLMIPNLANSSNAYFDGGGQPPLPLGNHPFFGYWEVVLDESVHNNFGISKTATTYQFNGAGQLSAGLRHYAIMSALLKPDSQNSITGRSCVIAHTVGIDRGAGSSTAEDREYARFFSGLALLHERVCTGVSQTGSKVLPLDELIYQLGNPLAPRSMGTLNQNNVTFTLRAPNQTIGVAKFYWAEFENGIVIVRGD